MLLLLLLLIHVVGEGGERSISSVSKKKIKGIVEQQYYYYFDIQTNERANERKTGKTTMSSEEKDLESGKTSTAVAPPAPLVAEIFQNTNNEDDEGPTNEQTDLMEFFQNLAQEMVPLQQQQSPPPPPPPEELAAASAAATESQKQQQKQQQHGHRSRGRRQGIKRSYISTDDHLDTLIGGSITSAAASAVVEPTIDNTINDGPMMMIQEHPGSPQKTHSSITPTPVHRTLANIEEQMVTIRNKLEKRSPKVTTAQLNQKLDRIINILRINGITE